MHLLRNERPPKSYVRVIFMKIPFRTEIRSVPQPESYNKFAFLATLWWTFLRVS